MRSLFQARGADPHLSVGPKNIFKASLRRLQNTCSSPSGLRSQRLWINAYKLLKPFLRSVTAVAKKI